MTVGATITALRVPPTDFGVDISPIPGYVGRSSDSPRHQRGTVLKSLSCPQMELSIGSTMDERAARTLAPITEGAGR